MVQLLTHSRRIAYSSLAAALLVVAWAAPSCGQGLDAAANFLLSDVNPNSASFQSQVSPRDYLQQVSGWYFGHAT